MEAITTTRPTPEGEMLWRVAFKGSYYDDDPRMPGPVGVGAVVYVLAHNLNEAKRKAEPFFKKARKDNEGEAKVEAHIATLEALVPVEETPDLRAFMSKYREVKLSDPEDAKRYRLAVCLVPVEES